MGSGTESGSAGAIGTPSESLNIDGALSEDFSLLSPCEFKQDDSSIISGIKSGAEQKNNGLTFSDENGKSSLLQKSFLQNSANTQKISLNPNPININPINPINPLNPLVNNNVVAVGGAGAVGTGVGVGVGGVGVGAGGVNSPKFYGSDDVRIYGSGQSSHLRSSQSAQGLPSLKDMASSPLFSSTTGMNMSETYEKIDNVLLLDNDCDSECNGSNAFEMSFNINEPIFGAINPSIPPK